MGFFSPKKTISVASTVYNMAGDEADRPNFLKTSLFSAVMNDSDPYLGESLVRNYLTGPGIKQRQFFNYSVQKDLGGLPTFSVRNSFNVDPDVVKGFIPIPSTPAGLVTEIQSAFIADGDFSYFAEQYVFENHPELGDTDFASEYDLDTHTITIQYEGGSTDVIPAGIYDPDKRFIIGYFFQHLPTSVEPLVTGTLVVDETDELNLPDTTGFTQDTPVNTIIVTHNIVTETTETRTYSDSTPTTVTVTNQDYDVDYNGTETVYSQSVYEGNSGDTFQTTTVETFHHIFERRHVVDRISTTVETNDLGGGVTETVTTEVDGGHLDPIWDYRTDTQDTLNQKIEGGSQLYIYEVGSGNATLDALEQTNVDATPEYYPFLPLRINNRSILTDHPGDYANYQFETSGIYEETVKAYRRVSGGQSFDSLVEEVEDNDDLDEIDYAYMSFGVSLNVTENACRKYMYQFFKDMIPFQNTTSSYVTNYIAGITNYEGARQTLEEWTTAQGDDTDPLYGTTQPPVPSLAQPETTTVQVNADHYQLLGFDNRITWIYIGEEFFSGVGQSGANPGDVWLQKGSVITWEEKVGISSLLEGVGTPTRADPSAVELTYIYQQIDETNYKRLSIYGLIHENFIYKGKAVRISAHEALDDNDTSGFLIPLHNPTVRAMSLVDSTQMATANTFLVFNSYQVVKKKWYQTFLGQLLIIIAIVVISVLISPAGVGAASGILGTNAAVGAGLGLTGTAAIVAGAVTNAIAAVIISRAISEVSVEVFGEKWGSIIGALASFALSFGMAGGFTNFNMATMINPQNILQMSSALANGYSGMVQADIASMQANMDEKALEYEKAMDELNQMIRDLGGNNDLSFDPMQLTDVDAGNGQGTGSYIPESLDEFIHRTTMSGSDIVDVTLQMITNHSDLTLQLPRN